MWQGLSVGISRWFHLGIVYGTMDRFGVCHGPASNDSHRPPCIRCHAPLANSSPSFQRPSPAAIFPPRDDKSSQSREISQGTIEDTFSRVSTSNRPRFLLFAGFGNVCIAAFVLQKRNALPRVILRDKKILARMVITWLCYYATYSDGCTSVLNLTTRLQWVGCNCGE